MIDENIAKSLMEEGKERKKKVLRKWKKRAIANNEGRKRKRWIFTKEIRTNAWKEDEGLKMMKGLMKRVSEVEI
jgi:hypothetical protein